MYQDSSYHRAYADLLLYLADQGIAPKTFATLETSKSKILQADPYATWVHNHDDFVKRPVSSKVLLQWRRKHAEFERAYQESFERGLLFYKEQLSKLSRNKKSMIPNSLSLALAIP